VSFLEERVCEDDELSHDGSDGKFNGLSSLDQVIIFRFHVGVKASCDEGEQVEGLAQAGPLEEVATSLVGAKLA
jgi:hypothetical protein